MLKNRIIPCLDVKNGRVVKGINFVDLVDAGDPVEQAKIYDEQGADELCFLDITASNENRNILLDTVKKTAEKCFMPLTVGGGVRTLQDIRNLLLAGADKVSINTAAIKNPKFITESSRAFGSSTIVVAVEVIKQPDNSYLAYTDNGREYTGVDVLSWVKEVEDRGAGEILLTSIDRDGTGSGFDIDLIKMVSSAVQVPVIAHGGCGSTNHIKSAINDGYADAIAISSMLHYGLINQEDNLLNKFNDEGNIEFLKKNVSFKIFGSESLTDVKQSLSDEKIPLRSIA